LLSFLRHRPPATLKPLLHWKLHEKVVFSSGRVLLVAVSAAHIALPFLGVGHTVHLVLRQPPAPTEQPLTLPHTLGTEASIHCPEQLY
jgi:hypothetical protein